MRLFYISQSLRSIAHSIFIPNLDEILRREPPTLTDPLSEPYFRANAWHEWSNQDLLEDYSNIGVRVYFYFLITIDQ